MIKAQFKRVFQGPVRCETTEGSSIILSEKIWVYLGVRNCEVFLCFLAIVRVRVYYVEFFVFFVLPHL